MTFRSAGAGSIGRRWKRRRDVIESGLQRFLCRLRQTSVSILPNFHTSRSTIRRCRHLNTGEAASDLIQFNASPTSERHKQPRIQMQEIDQRDRELLGALQSEIPLVSTPFALIGQAIDMSEKEVIKRIERLKRDGLVRQLAAQFDARALGYRSCLVAAKVDPERIDEAAATINAHPGVTQNYRRNNDFNLWFTIAVSPASRLGLERTIQILGEEAGCDVVRSLPMLKLFKSSADISEGHAEETHGDEKYVPLTPLEIECVRLLQRDLPLQPRPFDVLAKNSGVAADELRSTATGMQ